MLLPLKNTHLRTLVTLTRTLFWSWDGCDWLTSFTLYIFCQVMSSTALPCVVVVANAPCPRVVRTASPRPLVWSTRWSQSGTSSPLLRQVLITYLINNCQSEQKCKLHSVNLKHQFTVSFAWICFVKFYMIVYPTTVHWGLGP